MQPKILIIEDDADIAALLRTNISEAGYSVVHTGDGKEGLEKALHESFSLVIVDLNLPSMGGLDICRELRKEKIQQPILILTSRSEEIDRVLGLEIGADDYVTKPFSMREVLARVKALLRRSAQQAEASGSLLRFGSLVIDPQKRKVLRGEKLIELTAVEFDLLLFLALHPGRPFTRDELMEHVWGYQSSGFEPTITTHLSRLRSKVEPDPANPVFVKTVRGVGYRFAEPGDFP